MAGRGEPVEQAEHLLKVGADPPGLLTGIAQPLTGELPDRLQQPVAHRPAGLLGLHQGLVDQPADPPAEPPKATVTARKAIPPKPE